MLLGISAANADGAMSNEKTALRIIPYQELIMVLAVQRPPHLNERYQRITHEIFAAIRSINPAPTAMAGV